MLDQAALGAAGRRGVHRRPAALDGAVEGRGRPARPPRGDLGLRAGGRDRAGATLHPGLGAARRHVIDARRARPGLPPEQHRTCRRGPWPSRSPRPAGCPTPWPPRCAHGWGSTRPRPTCRRGCVPCAPPSSGSATWSTANPPGSAPPPRRVLERLDTRTADVLARAKRGADVGGLLGPLEQDAARAERDLIVGAVEPTRQRPRRGAGQGAARRAGGPRRRAARPRRAVRRPGRPGSRAWPCPTWRPSGPVPADPAAVDAYLVRLDAVGRAMTMAQDAYASALAERDELRLTLGAYAAKAADRRTSSRSEQADADLAELRAPGHARRWTGNRPTWCAGARSSPPTWPTWAAPGSAHPTHVPTEEGPDEHHRLRPARVHGQHPRRLLRRVRVARARLGRRRAGARRGRRARCLRHRRRLGPVHPARLHRNGGRRLLRRLRVTRPRGFAQPAGAAGAPSSMSVATMPAGVAQSPSTASRASNQLASTALGSVRASADGSKVTRRVGTASTRLRGARLGAGLTSIPPVPAVDAAKAVLENPMVPEDRRTCPSCGSPVGPLAATASRAAPRASARPAATRSRSRRSSRPATSSAASTSSPGRSPTAAWAGSTLARDRNVSDRWVVLKGLLNSGDPDALAAAIAERQFLAQVEHPLIVEIYNFVDARGRRLHRHGVRRRHARSSRSSRSGCARTGGAYDPLPVDQAIAFIVEILPALPVPARPRPRSTATSSPTT